MLNQRPGTGTTSTRSRPTGSPSGQPAQAAQQVGETARETVSRAAETAKQQADTQLDKVGGGLQQLAHSLHQSSNTLRQSNQPMVSDYIDRAAGQLERVSEYLRDRSVDQIVADVDTIARRESLVTVGVALGVGFLAARLLKASIGRADPGREAASPVYRTPAYSADRMDPIIQEEDDTPGAVGNRYGNGA